MAGIDYEDDEQRRRWSQPHGGLIEQQDPSYGGEPNIPPPNPPAPSVPAPTAGPDPSAFTLDQAREIAGRHGATIIDTELSDVTAVQQGRMSLAEFEERQRGRGASTSHRQADSQSAEGNALYGSGTGNGSNIPGGGFDLNAIAAAQSGGVRPGGPSPPGLNFPGFQFDDAYTQLFEQTARQQLERLTGQNAEMQRLMDFIGSQFDELSTSDGYSPAEMAMLRTQALEPIERDRAALNRRVLDRTSARGFMPTSGLHELDLRDVDNQAEQRRTVAQRDLGVNAIQKRQQDRAAALSLAQLGVAVPNQQGQQAMSVANSLYQIPHNALMDSLAVLNASSPQSAISPLLQQQQMAQQQQQYDQQQQQALWAELMRQFQEWFS